MATPFLDQAIAEMSGARSDDQAAPAQPTWVEKLKEEHRQNQAALAAWEAQARKRYLPDELNKQKQARQARNDDVLDRTFSTNLALLSQRTEKLIPRRTEIIEQRREEVERALSTVTYQRAQKKWADILASRDIDKIRDAYANGNQALRMAAQDSPEALKQALRGKPYGVGSMLAQLERDETADFETDESRQVTTDLAQVYDEVKEASAYTRQLWRDAVGIAGFEQGPAPETWAARFEGLQREIETVLGEAGHFKPDYHVWQLTDPDKPVEVQPAEQTEQAEQAE